MTTAARPPLPLIPAKLAAPSIHPGLLPRPRFDEWLQRFDDAFTEIRLQARGEDRAVLELIDWFIEDPANRTSAARRALPTSAEYSAIVARTLKEQKHARQH